MRGLVGTGLLMAACAAQAQTSPQATAHAPDGGVRQTVQSILVPPLTEAPFQATVTTEWIKVLPDGSRATTGNQRIIARDSSGRIFEERRYLVPNGSTQGAPISSLQYDDPNRHERLNCIPSQKTCYMTAYRLEVLSKMPAGIGGAEACGCGFPRGASVKQEALGQQTMENVEVTGSREIMMLAAGTFGNEKPEAVVKEFWYSPQLGLNLVTKRFDPRTGMQNFVVDHVSLSEPDTRMFDPPKDFKVVREIEPGLR